jgi:hypothetical protein
MKRFVIIALAVFLSTCAISQQAPPDPPLTPPPAAQQTGTFSIGPITLDVPSPIKIDTGSSGGGGGLMAAIFTLLGVLITALFGYVNGYWGRKETRDLTEREQQIKVDIAEKDLKAKDAELKNRAALADLELKTKQDHFDREQAAIEVREKQKRQAEEAAEKNKIMFEDNRYAIELRRLGVSDQEAYMAASRLEHDRKIAEVELIKSFSAQLLGKDEREQLFALLVLSTYISPQVIKKLATGGEEIVTTASLERLSAIDGDEIVSVARSILARRKSPAASEANPPLPPGEGNPPAATSEANPPAQASAAPTA